VPLESKIISISDFRVEKTKISEFKDEKMQITWLKMAKTEDFSAKKEDFCIDFKGF
jgi:hypothetical protein